MESPNPACPMAFLALYSKSSLALAKLTIESLKPFAKALPMSKPFSLNFDCNPVKVAIKPAVAVSNKLGSMLLIFLADIPARVNPSLTSPFIAS